MIQDGKTQFSNRAIVFPDDGMDTGMNEDITIQRSEEDGGVVLGGALVFELERCEKMADIYSGTDSEMGKIGTKTTEKQLVDIMMRYMSNSLGMLFCCYSLQG